MKLNQILLNLCIFLVSITQIDKLNAQVTIGSNAPPATGALLDLKQENKTDGSADSKKGLGLPRVKLKALDELTMGINEIENKDTVWEDHTGLMVYHISGEANPECAEIIDGIYVWDGEMWQSLLGNSNNGGASSLIIKNGAVELADGVMIDIASGNDARGTTIPDLNLTLEWNGTSLTLTPTAKTGGSMSPAAAMITSPAWTRGTDANIINKPENMTIKFANMTSVIQTNNPWKSREWELKFKVVNACGGEIIKTIILNQTNYALRVNDSFQSSIASVIKDTSEKAFTVLGNAEWKMTVDDTYGVLASITPASGTTGGTTLKDGNVSSSSTIKFTGDATKTGIKYERATITFSDTESTKRFVDIEVSATTCLGSPNMSSITTNATPTQTSSATDIWGNDVVHHLAKDNPAYNPGVHPDESRYKYIYEDFYSAKFGDAGRWMIINFSAYAYDNNIHTQSRVLEGPRGSDTELNTAYWSYPRRQDESVIPNEPPSAEYIANPHLGLLYTWDAATAGKGGSDGESNIYGPVNEIGLRPEGTNGGINEEKRIQGICPEGWHLPNDWEWTELEQEIIKHTPQYAYVTNAIDPGGTDPLAAYPVIQYGVGTSGIIHDRGTTHGYAMTDPCEASGGYARHPRENGFLIMLSGYIKYGKGEGVGRIGGYHTSSSYSTVSNYTRDKHSTRPGMTRNYNMRNWMFSVRCKKNN